MTTARPKLESKTFKVADLTTYIENPRVGDIDTIAESLVHNGQYRRIVVNAGTHTGRRHEVLAGNHTYLAIKALHAGTYDDKLPNVRRADWATVAADVVDVTEAHARRIVAADNRTAEKATYDDQILADLLQEIAADDAGLLGTGYNEDDLDDLLLSLDRPDDDQLDSGPDLDRGPVVQYTLIFDDEAQQDRWFAFLRWLRDHHTGDTVAERLNTYLGTLDVGSVGDDED